MIRPISPDDVSTLISMTRDTGMFKPLEIRVLQELLADFLKGEEPTHHAVVYETEGKPAGFAYFGPTPMTEGTWHLWWIVVSPHTQARGLGTTMLHYAENEAREAKARMLLVETSALPHYELTRRFYFKHGYERIMVIRDFYADGDDLVVFQKRFAH